MLSKSLNWLTGSDMIYSPASQSVPQSVYSLNLEFPPPPLTLPLLLLTQVFQLPQQGWRQDEV